MAVTTLQPLPQLPKVPCLNDTIAGFNLSTWFGLFASAGLNATHTERMVSAFASTLQQKDVQQYFDSMGVLREDLRQQEFARFVRAEHARYGQLLQASHMLGSNPA